MGQMGALGELSTPGSQSENFAAVGEGARGWPYAPAAGVGWGCASPLGPLGLGFCLAPLPLLSERGDRREGGTAASRVFDPTPCFPRARPGPAALSSLLPASLERFPAPPPAEDGCPGLEVGG